MEFIAVLVAAVAAFAFGAVWYMALAKPWMAASGVAVGADGKPANNANALPYITSLVAAILVAGMMRHVFATSEVNTVWEGFVSGLGVGLFFISPWIAMNNMFAGRPFALTLIDGGYAVCGTAIMGIILMLF